LKIGRKSRFRRRRHSWWRAIATADFNGDGRPDYVVGNLGLNTRYHATRSNRSALSRRLRRDGAFRDRGYTKWPALSVADPEGIGGENPRNTEALSPERQYARATLGEILAKTGWPPHRA